jgi:putative intracellular protease/amidase
VKIAIPIFDQITALDAIGPYEVLSRLPDAKFDELAKYGATAVTRRVVEQGKVITAAGVSSGIDMALTLASRIAGDVLAQAIQVGIEYDPEPPFDSGCTEKAPTEIIELVKSRRARLA